MEFREKALEEARLKPKSTKAKILKAAEDLFAKQGYDGTTTRDIADATGINIAQLHYHWGSKEELWNAVHFNLLTQVTEAASVFIKTAFKDGASAGLRETIRTLFNFVADNPNIPLLIRHSGISPKVKPWALDVGVPYIEFVENVFENETDIDFSPVETRVAIYAFIGAFETFFIRPGVLKAYFGEDASDMTPEFREKAIEALCILAERFGQLKTS